MFFEEEKWMWLKKTIVEINLLNHKSTRIVSGGESVVIEELIFVFKCFNHFNFQMSN